jgi:hypothetical protein
MPGIGIRAEFVVAAPEGQQERVPRADHPRYLTDHDRLRPGRSRTAPRLDRRVAAHPVPLVGGRAVGDHLGQRGTYSSARENNRRVTTKSRLYETSMSMT